jgi:hypothetical protein
VKIYHRNYRKIGPFSHKGNGENSCRLALKEILKKVLQAEGK